jgi:hypothetical protein
MDRGICTLSVVTPEISSIRRSLIKIRLRRRSLAFELQDHDGPSYKQDYIWTARLKREFVFEDGSVIVCPRVLLDNFMYFGLKLGNGVIPSAYLLFRRVWY